MSPRAFAAMTGTATRCARPGWRHSARGSRHAFSAAAARRRETAPELWFTYHLYHKAPDWLGPADCRRTRHSLCRRRGLRRAKAGARGWAAGRRAAERAIRRADAVIGLNPADRDCVLPLLRDPWRWVAFKPFLDAASYRPASMRRTGPPRLITVAMMRHGDKLASYRLLGDALVASARSAWSLEVVGDGPARREVEDALAPLDERVIWAGALGPTAIARPVGRRPICSSGRRSTRPSAWRCSRRRRAGCRWWPAQRRRQRDRRAGITGLLVPPGDAPAFAAAVRSLIVDRGRRAAFAEAARRRARAEHDLSLPPLAASTAVIDASVSRRNLPGVMPGADELHDRLRPVLCPAPARDRAFAARVANCRRAGSREGIGVTLVSGGEPLSAAGMHLGRTRRPAAADQSPRRGVQRARRRGGPADRRRRCETARRAALLAAFARRAA